MVVVGPTVLRFGPSAALGLRAGPVVRAIGLGAVRVQVQRMLANREATFLGHAHLALFDFGVVELFDASALDAHEVVVVRALVQLEHRLAGLEMMALEDAGLLELGEDPVHGGETHVQSLGHEDPVDVFRREVAHLAALEKLENSKPRPRGLQAYGFQVVDVGHERISASGRGPVSAMI